MAEPVTALIDKFTIIKWPTKVRPEREETRDDSAMRSSKLSDTLKVKGKSRMKRPDRYQNGPSTPRSSVSKARGRSNLVCDAADDENDPIKHPELLSTKIEWKSNADMNLEQYDKRSDWYQHTKKMREAILLKD
jgi:hypothetical protein